ncbi:MAG: hypothetical protein CMJ25_18450 [Phycisphaerae bacterium]|nr:hypothetical protein [Phycisphaerae bacterium]|tara:strand:+ start:328 stop:588 length:261 start_codon:yes stop_codon:yes gene_type:complete
MAKSKAKKLTKKELEDVKDLQQKINTLLMNIGNAELVKNTLCARHTELQAEWKDTTTALEDKYGSVNISLEDGTLSEVEENAEAVA